MSTLRELWEINVPVGTAQGDEASNGDSHAPIALRLRTLVALRRSL